MKIANKLRYFLKISYKGTRYHGWQAQPNASSIQAEINNALATIFQKDIETTGSGRTDAGVHAKMQVCHCELTDILTVTTLIHKMNSILPRDIIVNELLQVKEDAHARFDALSRSYEYHIHFDKSPFGADEYSFLPVIPDFELMNKACQSILGEHDFTSFAKVKTDVNNFNCHLFEAKWLFANNEAVFHITANRFLRGMVRAMVGTLLKVGFGKISLEEFTNIVNAKDRTLAGQSVSPNGLYLCNVRYPSEIFINN